LWREADGRISGGHMLPEETFVAEPFEVRAFGIDGAIFAAEHDPETKFKLFGPVPAKSSEGANASRRAFAMRLRPNQDFAGSLEAFCRDHGIARARFTNGDIIEPFATELAITSGAITAGEATLDVALIDYTGGIGEGRLIRGDNPVLMTMELVLEVLS
jgi:predicted DNA-binding protein with PD1-like motif